jgi:hypothetical protein
VAQPKRPQVVHEGEVTEGDLLIGHNLLITPALLLEKQLRLDEARLLDFCTLVNALVLHDRIITLPAEIPEILEESRLYKYLIDRGILYELDFDYSKWSDDERQEILQLVGFGISEQEVDEAMKKMHDYLWREIITDPKIPQQLHGRNEYDINTPWQEQRINQQRAILIESIINVRRGDPNTADAAIALLNTSEVLYLRNEDLRHHLLRTAAYREVSGMLSMAFLPDFIRIPIIARYNARVRQSLRTLIQSSIDTAVRKELEDALRIASVNVVPIPNAVSNFFDKYSQSGMEEALNELRMDFSDHKKTIVNWEKRIRTTDKKGYGEALRVMNEIKASLAALQPTDKVEMLLSVTPGVVADIVEAALTGGSLGPGTFVEPVKEALNLARRWRQRARISFFNTGKNEAAKIQNQSELLKKAFGRSLTPTQTDRFLMLTDSLQRLTQPAIS